jgi:hypothetical protein
MSFAVPRDAASGPCHWSTICGTGNEGVAGEAATPGRSCRNSRCLVLQGLHWRRAHEAPDQAPAPPEPPLAMAPPAALRPAPAAPQIAPGLKHFARPDHHRSHIPEAVMATGLATFVSAVARLPPALLEAPPRRGRYARRRGVGRSQGTAGPRRRLYAVVTPVEEVPVTSAIMVVTIYRMGSWSALLLPAMTGWAGGVSMLQAASGTRGEAGRD